MLICRKFLAIHGNNSSRREDDTFSIAVNDTEHVLRRSLLQMDKLGGVFDPATSQKSRQIYGFLKAMRPMVVAGDFAFERATTLLQATSHCNFLSLHCASIITDNIKVFLRHYHVLPICERMLLTLLRNLKTQGARRDAEATARVVWSTLHLLQVTRAQDPALNSPLQTTMMFQHYAICDMCRHVRYLGEPPTPHFMER